jgi:HTH-type transcriptional regulator / antitoxin HigA
VETKEHLAMITNERQYRLTKAQAEKFRLAIEAFDAKSALASGFDPLIVRAQLNALESQHEELLEQIAEYERIKSAPTKQLTAETLEELPEVLIKARIARKLSQKDLAQRLGMKEQQIQRYEAERYQSASLRRLTEIAKGLEIRCRIGAELADSGERQCLKSV